MNKALSKFAVALLVAIVSVGVALGILTHLWFSPLVALLMAWAVLYLGFIILRKMYRRGGGK